MTNGTLVSPKIFSPGLRLIWPPVKRKFARSTSGPASVAAKPSPFAATDAVLSGRTGLGVRTQVQPVAPSRRRSIHAPPPSAA
ncbi:hypothetical protein [Streptomyces sp. NBC_01244]|uniref:hypothetical protein n=1 Tax=Streptomyces sp. NBC_01244 TaxID=2903797 RepID=UPI002E13F772